MRSLVAQLNETFKMKGEESSERERVRKRENGKAVSEEKKPKRQPLPKKKIKRRPKRGKSF